MKKRIGWLFVLPLLVNVSVQQNSFAFSSIEFKQDYLNNKLIFDFEDDGAHRSSGNNSYTSVTNTYNENNSEISLTYADSVTSGTPLNGSANILGRIAKNTKNSPVILIKDIDVSGYTFSALEFTTKGVAAMGMAVEYKAGSFDGSGAWTSIGSIATMPTKSTVKSFDNLEIVEDTLSLRFTVSVPSTTTSNRDFQIDDVTLKFEEISKEKTITLSSKNLYTKVGSNLDITAKSLNYDVAPTLTWSSSDETVATVSNGVLTPLSYGKTTIKATDTDTTNSVESNALEITVYPNNDTDISIATALAVCELTGNAKSPYEYSTSGLVDTVTDTEKVDIYDGEMPDSITAYGINSTLFKPDQKIRVTGYLINYDNTTPEFDKGCTYQTYHTITYVFGNGDANVVLNDVLSGTTLEKPTDPVRDGYTFVGWFDGNDTQWDFDNKTVSEDITLTAKWMVGSVQEVQSDLNEINPYFAMAYKYEAIQGKLGTIVNSLYSSDSDRSSKVTSKDEFEDDISSLPSEISDMSLTNVFPGKNHTIKMGTSSAGGSLTFESTIKINRILVTASQYKSEEDAFQIGDNKYKATGEEVTCSFDNGQDSVTISSSKRLYISKIVFVFEGNDLTYTDVDLRLKVAVDDMSTFAGVYDSIQDYGIEVRTSAKTKKYAHSAMLSETKGNKDYRYQVITLGDVINHPERLEDEFTIRAYAVYGSETLYSTSEKTYSVVTLVQEYYSNESTRSIITPFYNLLVSMGKITA